MGKLVDFLIWAADYAPADARGEALEIVRDVVEAVNMLCTDKEKNELFALYPWFAEMENLYVYYFCESDDLLLA